MEGFVPWDSLLKKCVRKKLEVKYYLGRGV